MVPTGQIVGFACVLRDKITSFPKASKEEAASIGANTNIRYVKLEDPQRLGILYEGRWRVLCHNS